MTRARTTPRRTSHEPAPSYARPPPGPAAGGAGHGAARARPWRGRAHPRGGARLRAPAAPGHGGRAPGGGHRRGRAAVRAGWLRHAPEGPGRVRALQLLPQRAPGRGHRAAHPAGRNAPVRRLPSGTGQVPPYYGEYETLSGGELRAGVEIPLWRNRSIDKRRADVAKARLRLDIAGFTLAGEQLGLQREAAYHYWDWVAAGQQLAIAEAQYSLAVTRHEQLARRVAQGDIPQLEHTENERALLEREAERVAARRKLDQTALKLSLYLRDGEGRPVRVSTSRLPESLPMPDDAFEAELDAWLEKALRQRPELRELALQGEVVQLDAELARNQTAPAVDLGVAVLRDFGRGPDSLRPTELQASLMLDIPLQARGARGQARAAEAKRAAVDAKARLTQDKVVTEVRDTLSALHAAHERVGLAKSAADVARRLARAELARFEHGATSLLFVNLREQTAADAELKEVKALVDYHRAVVDLLAATAALEPRRLDAP
ncbi:TolC family protein [Archangium gephyra]|nr:TolC family protein [Archangium gephyra]